jgi:hypothetical protein
MPNFTFLFCDHHALTSSPVLLHTFPRVFWRELFTDSVDWTADCLWMGSLKMRSNRFESIRTFSEFSKKIRLKFRCCSSSNEFTTNSTRILFDPQLNIYSGGRLKLLPIFTRLIHDFSYSDMEPRRFHPETSCRVVVLLTLWSPANLRLIVDPARTKKLWARGLVTWRISTAAERNRKRRLHAHLHQVQATAAQLLPRPPLHHQLQQVEGWV